MFLDEFAFNHRRVGHNVRTAVLEDKCASLASDWIGDAARPAKWNPAKIERQTKPVIF